MAFIVVETPEDDFWEKNPSTLLIDEFREFKEKEGHDRSSSILKAIYYIWDPKSDIRDSSISEVSLIRDVTTNLIDDEEFNWEEYTDIRDFYLETNTSRLEKMLLDYEKEITDLKAFLDEWKLNKKDIKDRMAAVKGYKDLFTDYLEVKEKVKAEEEHLMEMYGGYQKSLLEELGSE